MKPLFSLLEGGDRRSVRGVPEVIRRVESDPTSFGTLIEGLVHPNPLIRMRCADAVEKITATHPEYLAPYRRQLLDLAAAAEQKEVRWHIAQIIPRLSLGRSERRKAVAILEEYLDDESRIVVTWSMNALAELALQDPSLRGPIVRRIRKLTATGSPAMRSRGRKLLEKLGVRD